MPHRFLRKQSCWGSGSRRFGEQCLFDFLESNHVGSLALEIRRASTLPRSTEVDTQGLSNYPAMSDVVGAASFTCSTLAKLSVVPMSYCCVWEVGD
ncbi:hypothetical protein ACFX2B_005453 [Malus domestica]